MRCVGGLKMASIYLPHGEVPGAGSLEPRKALEASFEARCDRSPTKEELVYQAVLNAEAYQRAFQPIRQRELESR